MTPSETFEFAKSNSANAMWASYDARLYSVDWSVNGDDEFPGIGIFVSARHGLLDGPVTELIRCTAVPEIAARVDEVIAFVKSIGRGPLAMIPRSNVGQVPDLILSSLA
jgi:hypothetical protein